jgi:hypothetical protein
MALNINIPQPNQTLAQTQLDIKNNFIFINTGFAFDHVEFNVTGAGKHNKITFPVQSPAPGFVDVGDLGLFSFLNATTTKHELNVYKANGPTPTGYVNVPFTASILSNSAPIQNGAGWSYLPSGLIIQWGKVSAGINGNLAISTTFNFPITFPTQALNIQISQDSHTFVERQIFNAVQIDSQTQFTIRTFRSDGFVGPTTAGYYYFAIGY